MTEVIALRCVQFGREIPKIPWNMQAANVFPFQGDDMINVVSRRTVGIYSAYHSPVDPFGHILSAPLRNCLTAYQAAFNAVATRDIAQAPVTVHAGQAHEGRRAQRRPRRLEDYRAGVTNHIVLTAGGREDGLAEPLATAPLHKGWRLGNFLATRRRRWDINEAIHVEAPILDWSEAALGVDAPRRLAPTYGDVRPSLQAIFSSNYKDLDLVFGRLRSFLHFLLDTRVTAGLVISPSCAICVARSISAHAEPTP